MALKKSEKRLLIVLGIAVAVFLLDTFVLSKRDEPSVDTPAHVQQTVANAIAANINRATTKTSAAAEGKTFDSWGRDPFRTERGPSRSGSTVVKSSGTEKKESLPKLKGLFWKAGDAYVMVGNNILKEGEEKEGLKIERVEGKSVFCRQGNRTFTLYWSESL